MRAFWSVCMVTAWAIALIGAAKIGHASTPDDTVAGLFLLGAGLATGPAMTYELIRVVQRRWDEVITARVRRALARRDAFAVAYEVGICVVFALAVAHLVFGWA